MKTTSKKNSKKDVKPTNNQESKVKGQPREEQVKKSKINDNKTILVSTDLKGHGFYTFLAKKFLEDQEVVELTGLGQGLHLKINF